MLEYILFYRITLLQHLIPYLLVSCCFYFLFYFLLKKKMTYKKIQQKNTINKDIMREFLYSLLSIVFFAFFVTVIFKTSLINYSFLYTNINEHSKLYFLFTIFLCILIQDTWFYWMHRLMHIKIIFKYIHIIHHKSINPTPFSAYSFHPIEAFIESSVFYIILFIIPIHPLAVFIAVNLSLLINVYGHLGYEIFPKKITKTFLFKIINTSVHHNMHHRNIKGNYGLYFRFWDKLMGTEFKDYEKKFNEVVNKNIDNS